MVDFGSLWKFFQLTQLASCVNWLTIEQLDKNIRHQIKDTDYSSIKYRILWE